MTEKATTTLQNLQAGPSLAPRNDAPMSLTTGAGFDQLQRVAKALCSSTLVPVQYRAFVEVKEFGKVTGYTPNAAGLPNCIVALNMAQRMNADPLLVMQNLHIIEGRPSWSSPFIIAAVNHCGRFSPLRFELSKPSEPVEVTYIATVWKNKVKTEETRKVTVRHQTCIAWAVEASTDIPQFPLDDLKAHGGLYGCCKAFGIPLVESPTVSIQMAIDEGWLTKNGSKWQTMPEVMLRYRAASLFGRLYAPELLMGLQSQEEAEDIAAHQAREVSGTRLQQVDLDDLREPQAPAIFEQDDANADEPATSGETVDTTTGEIKSEPAKKERKPRKQNDAEVIDTAPSQNDTPTDADQEPETGQEAGALDGLNWD